MGRLIDEDMLIKELYEDGTFPLTAADRVAAKINELPEAFDLVAVENELEKLEQHYRKCCLCDYNDGAAVAIQESRVIVRKGATGKRVDNGWIPVNEPPKDNKYILLSFENFSIPCVGRYEEDETGSGAYYIGDEDVSCLSQELFVNAWQPLPEPYKG